jgi:hypothetical protein
VTADYLRCTVRDAFVSSIVMLDPARDWALVLDALKQYQINGRSNLRVSLLVGCTLIESTAPASQPAVGRGRRTATASQFNELAEHLDEEAAREDYSTALRLRWICRNNNCLNHKEHWYERAPGDPKRNHFPLYTPVLKEWIKAIRDGVPEASVENPPSSVVFLIKDAEHVNRADHRRPGRVEVEAPPPLPAWQHPSQQYAGPPQQTVVFNGSVDLRALTALSFGVSTAAAASPANDVRSSPTMQSEADRLMEEFFAWALV